MVQYAPIRFPMKAYQNITLKKQLIEQDLKKITRKRIVNIPYTKLIEVMSEYPLKFSDDELVKKFGIKFKRWR